MFSLNSLAMGADLAGFSLFAGTLGKMREIWMIHWKIQVFSADGQRSESMEIYWINITADFTLFTGTLDELCEICVICWNSAEIKTFKLKILPIILKTGNTICYG